VPYVLTVRRTPRITKIPSYETTEMLVNAGEGMVKELNSKSIQEAIVIPINQGYNPS